MQVLLCLQSNALKFTRNGEVHIVVTTDEEFLRIEVRDTGIGISKEDQKKLFKLFGFLEENKAQQMNKNGVGLGLYIAKQITNQFDGDIDVDSEVGEGSTFTIKFKLYNTEERGHSQDYNKSLTSNFIQNS